MNRTQEDQEMPVAVPCRKTGPPQPPQYSLPFDQWQKPATGGLLTNNPESMHQVNSGSMQNRPSGMVHGIYFHFGLSTIAGRPFCSMMSLRNPLLSMAP